MLDRTKDYSSRQDVKEDLADLYQDVVKAFDDKKERAENNKRFWDVYNCALNDNQKYNGDSQVYLPMVRNAIDARVQRFSGTMFPKSGRHVEVVSEPGDIPHEVMSLLDHYVEKARLRTEVVPALLRQGDVTGQYSVYVDWQEVKRTITKRTWTPVEIDEGVEDPTHEDIEDIEDEDIVEARPDVRVLADDDLCVLPATVDSIDDAEVVAVILRLTKRDVKRRMKDGTFTKKAGKILLDRMGNAIHPQWENPDKERASAAGVRVTGGRKVAWVFEIWSTLKVEGEDRSVVSYHAGDDLCLGCRLNPFWSGKVPVISAPLKKVAGSFWGGSAIDPVEQMQYLANDLANIASDSAMYSLMPIVMTDPAKNPRYASMVLTMAAVWETSPADTQIVSFPQLYKEALPLLAETAAHILSSLGVTASMLPSPHQSSRKPSQAQASQEQAQAIEVAVEAVGAIEQSILSPLLERFFELDQQFRDKGLQVECFGELGARAQMITVPPQQYGTRFQFNWIGSESTRSTQMIQQKIAGLNVLRSLGPEQLRGRQLDVSPIIEQLVEDIYGPRLAPKVLVDRRHAMGLPPELENQILALGHPCFVNQGDNDLQHISVHMMAPPDAQGLIKAHVIEHQQKMQQQSQQLLGGPGGRPGAPGGAGPGIAGSPRPGAVPAPPRGGQAPPGAIHQDQIQDAGRMPRR